MRKLGLALLLAVGTARGTFAQTPVTAIHIQATGDGFENYLAAALAKKHVPARLVDRADPSALTLKASPVQVQKDSASTKVMKCVFSSCAGIEARASTSVKLVDPKGTILWSYSVSGDRDDQSRMAEAIAKHLKTEYFRQ